MAMVDCSGRFCDSCHGQFVKDGSALVFYGGFSAFGQPQSITLIDRDYIILSLKLRGYGQELR